MSGVGAQGPMVGGPSQEQEARQPLCPHPSPHLGGQAPSPGPARRERRGTTSWAGARQAPACVQRRAGWAQVARLSAREARHADLGAALAQDGELGAPIHAAAGQGRMPVLEIHGEVAVHLPAPPLPAVSACTCGRQLGESLPDGHPLTPHLPHPGTLARPRRHAH